ncbi:PPC domain-containing DNA-binding protein [Tepidibacter thalassicus]|nr:PPC domain-containing DNA-binding protein [Tepidibacter thalassicus]
MKSKKFGNKYVLRIDKGEKIVDTLKQFCIDNKITLGTIHGIGATNKATIGFFNLNTKEYNSTELIGDYEITCIIGNISTKNGEVYLHLHINLSDENYKTFGGHLTEAVVSATCEIIIDVIDGNIEREFNENIGINTYKM